MRVLILSWEYPPYVVGGMGKHVAELVPMLGGLATDTGLLQVDLVTTDLSGGPTVEAAGPHTTIHRVAVPPLNPIDLYNSVVGSNDHLIQRARELQHQQHYDAIHIHDWLVGVVGATLKHEWKVPLIATIHATERGRFQGNVIGDTSHQIDRLEWLICHESWRVIVCSRYMMTELNSFFRTPHDKITMIANGINLNRLHRCPPGEREALRRRYAPNGERLLFFVGRIEHEKGLHVLIKAMPEILTDFPGTRLLVAGRNGQKMLPLAYEMGVASAIDFLGYVSDEERDYLYQAVDAAVFPSLYEPFGIVALEAMAQECNVIASNVGGLGEVVQHLQTGLSVYPDDPASIAWAVRHLFRDPEAARQRRERALYHVLHFYNWQEIGDQTTLLYQRVVNERRLTTW